MARLRESAHRIRWYALDMGEMQGQGYIGQALGVPMSAMASYTPGMEISGGSLGHGLGIATGRARGLRPASFSTVRSRPGLARSSRRTRTEGTMVLPYCYAVIEGEGHLAVVDTGFDWADYGEVLARTFGVSDWQPPAVVLGRLGLDPSDVDTVILTHNHFDHAGGVDLFPNARVVLQSRELSHYQWVQGLPGRLQWLSTACDPDLALSLAQRAKAGKLTLVDGDAEVLPGVHVVPAFDTHTAGSAR